MAQPLTHIIGGRPFAATATQWEPIYNPATEDVLAEVPLDDQTAVSAAVDAASTAFSSWKNTPIFERARIMFRYWELLQRHREELARLVTQEHGKVLADADQEVGRGIEVVELAASAPSLLKGEILPLVAHGVEASMLRVPLGVVAGITPFNFPAMIPLWMIPPAVVAGNTFVLKPSERTPLTSMRLLELLREAGLPDGVVNLIHGGKSVVDAVLSHPEIRAVSFVGSQPVAEYVYRTAAYHGKRVQALGGAKNFHVVMPDAELPKTVEALIGSAFGAAGERCLAGSVVLAVGHVADRLQDALVEAGRSMTVGPGWEPGTDMGPLIRQSHRERVRGYIARGISEGARLILDGRQHALPERGFFLGPTIFDGVDPRMTIAREEIFGPVLSMIRVPDLATAVAIANGSSYGNTATIYTESGGHAQYFRDHIQAGMVGINIGVAAPVAVFPFAGWKHSFYGDLHATGMDAFMFYTERRVVTARWWR
ncbi:methylmalonate-semialdehyde dehydrogenase [Sulfobacillus acidophilus TPY]|uniref:methylmalonate-semialdehyde dehydrogenase (CoA acylating) n=1 Tax=Sulfobacillus acidophilus (strain ATCC 700253 / DSM 10332 / NAL) TaxID=679936 RepID=G8TW29_SULAD|nr:methylmalonate-semialdehyde dehydrogenase [Sulfobacillus acidophilus TPY]AEW05956.1 methylmalonate-semialdehyde dehydrogenase [Sulfobacillus acidophilus DSM 10332]